MARDEKRPRVEIPNTESSVASGQVLTIDQYDAVLTRKIDWHIVPVMFLCYFCQFLDKVVLNYANIIGLTTSLHMNADQFAWLATAFFISYAVAEIPQGYLLQKFSMSRVLGFNVLCWGITLCYTAAVTSYAGIVALRVLLGAFEAIITPALIMITSVWYPKKLATPRIGVWYCGLGAGQILGGLVSFGAQHGSRDGSFPSWKIMFLSVGMFNLLVALGVFLLLPRSVESATFLSNEEKSTIRIVLALD